MYLIVPGNTSRLWENNKRTVICEQLAYCDRSILSVCISNQLSVGRGAKGRARLYMIKGSFKEGDCHDLDNIGQLGSSLNKT